LGQLDPPRGPRDDIAKGSDRVWALDENANEGIERMFTKAVEALVHLKENSPSRAEFKQSNLASSLTRHQRAVLHREAVRRFNGGREFTFDGRGWVVNPSPGSAARTELNIAYPNKVLGTNVIYAPLLTDNAATARFGEEHYFGGL
jgi:hypothetical protein